MIPGAVATLRTYHLQYEEMPFYFSGVACLFGDLFIHANMICLIYVND